MWVESYAGGLSFYLKRVVPVATTDGDELRSNYILRNHDRFLQESDLLIPLAEAGAAVGECGVPRVFLLGRGSPELADLISETRPSIATGSRRWKAYGPECLAVVTGTSDAEIEVDPAAVVVSED